jgi:hypothetical protein
MQMEQTDSTLPELTEACEDGFVDCTFKIEDLRSDAEHYYFRMTARHEGEVVGLAPWPGCIRSSPTIGWPRPASPTP